MRRLGPWMILVLACGPGDSSLVTSDESSSSSGPAAESSSEGGTSSSGVGSSSSASVDESTSSVESSSSTGPSTTCGDGNLDTDLGEECDDGNVDDGDTCSSVCVVPFTIAWTHTADGGDGLEDLGRGVAIGDDGSIYVVGTVRTLANSDDLWLRQYAPDGTEGWTFTFDGADSLHEKGYGVAVHPSGDLVVVGSTESTATGLDVLVLRVALADQSVVWQRIYDGTQPDTGSMFGDEGLAIAVDANGDVVAGGNAFALDLGFDMWVGRYDADGVELWTNAFPGDSSEKVEGLAVDDDGTIWMVGTATTGAADFVGLIRGVDASGDLVVEQSFADHRLSDVVLTDDGDLLVVGSMPGPSSDGVVLRLAPDDLSTTWSSFHDGPDMRSDGLRGVALAPAGELYVAGYETIQHRGNDADMWIGRLDAADGAPVWGDRYGNRIHFGDYAEAIAIAPDGGIVVVGSTGEPGEDNNIFIRKYLEP